MVMAVMVLICLLSHMSVSAQSSDLYAYYTKVHPGQDSQQYSITGKYADVIVGFDENRQFVFSRESSYLSYWQTENGKWYVDEIIPRSGDGTKLQPDKYNRYSYVRIIENTPDKVVIHWRYFPDFMHVEMTNVVHELFTITPDGQVGRKFKKGTEKIGDWI